MRSNNATNRSVPIAPVSLGMILVAMLTFAGCVGATHPQPSTPAASEEAPVPPTLALSCPYEGRLLQNGICVADLTDPRKSLFEPYLAVHRTENKIWAVMAHGGIFLTKDAGQAWTRLELGWDYTDPVIEFDDTGRLHISGMGLGGIFWAASDDLGAHWTTPVVLTRGGDRDWMTIGPGGSDIFVSWQEYDGGPGPTESVVAWSLDAGTTWRTLDKSQRPACPNTGRIFLLEAGPVFGCTSLKWHYNESFPLSRQAPLWYESVVFDSFEGRFYRLDTKNGSLFLWSNLTDWRGYMPHILPAPDGSLIAWTMAWVINEDARHNALMIARSTDGAKTWKEFVNLRSIASVDDRWTGAPFIGWAAVDPWGSLHFLIYNRDNYNRPIRDSPYQGGPFTPIQPVISPSTVAHLQLDARTFTLLSEKQLTSNFELDEMVTIPSAGGRSSGGDHFYGLAFGQAYGVAMWTRHGPADAGLRYALLVHPSDA